jgi:serine O-acetyltransferase
MEDHENFYDQYLDAYLDSFDRYGQSSFISFRPIPSMTAIESIVEEFMELLFPGRSGKRVYSNATIRELVAFLLRSIGESLEKQIFIAWFHDNPLQLADNETTYYHNLAHKTTMKLFKALPTLRTMMKEDAQSAFDGDPAATSIRETIISYPSVRALTIHRIANFLYKEKVPLIPRMLSETVHKQTGIDIHPGATIGRCLFIDHGTGVVIGETSVIGNQVKIYQGVTLGALSFPKNACGSLIRGTKRHPTLQNRVTVYANATLLGDIVIGENTIIGSNAWIRHDIPANTLVQNEEPKSIMREINPKTPKKSCDTLTVRELN